MILATFVQITIYRIPGFWGKLWAGKFEPNWSGRVVQDEFKGIWKDFKKLMIFLFWTLLLLLSVIRFPAFLSKIPDNLHGLDELTILAKSEVF